MYILYVLSNTNIEYRNTWALSGFGTNRREESFLLPPSFGSSHKRLILITLWLLAHDFTPVFPI